MKIKRELIIRLLFVVLPLGCQDNLTTKDGSTSSKDGSTFSKDRSRSEEVIEDVHPTKDENISRKDRSRSEEVIENGHTMKENGCSVHLMPSATGGFTANCYVLACKKTKEALIIDPANQTADSINKFLEERESVLKAIIITHGHYDHIRNSYQLAEQLDTQRIRNVQAPPRGPRDKLVSHNEKWNFGKLEIIFIHTPGHSSDSMCIKVGNEVIFTGDTLFADGRIGTTVTPEAREQLARSIREHLKPLPDEMVIYPGHGNSSTIGEERKLNPLLQQ
jgi:glyoxylase-like metal-dependent hydrolase (beta-lactamase superfamily II)